MAGQGIAELAAADWIEKPQFAVMASRSPSAVVLSSPRQPNENMNVTSYVHVLSFPRWRPAFRRFGLGNMLVVPRQRPIPVFLLVRLGLDRSEHGTGVGLLQKPPPRCARYVQPGVALNCSRKVAG